jgi:hypothetical protein
MGNTISPEFDAAKVMYQARKSYGRPSFYPLKFDRILDGENEVYIGIGKSATQVIRIGDHYSKCHKLLNFTQKGETNDSVKKLKYEFEDDVTLILEKQDETVHMTLMDMYSNTFVSKPVDPVIKKYFTPIGLKPCSNDLDAISEMFNSI